MAIQTGAIKFTGKLGDIVGYRIKRKHAIRSLPETVHQTPATKRAARDFGVISRQGKLIRKAIVPYLDMKYDGSLVNRLNRELLLAGKPRQKGPSNKQTWLQRASIAALDIHNNPSLPQGAVPENILHNHPSRQQRTAASLPQDGLTGMPTHTGQRAGIHQCLLGFAFNPHTGIDKLLTRPPVFSADGLLQLPAQLFRNTGRATHLQVRAIGVRINFTERRVVDMDEVSAVIDLQCPFNGLELSLSVPGKGRLFVVLQLQSCTICNKNVYPLRDRRYMAADIIAIAPSVAAAHQPAHRSSFTKHQMPVKRHKQNRQYNGSHGRQHYNNMDGLNDTDGLPPSQNAFPGMIIHCLPIHPNGNNFAARVYQPLSHPGAPSSRKAMPITQNSPGLPLLTPHFDINTPFFYLLSCNFNLFPSNFSSLFLPKFSFVPSKPSRFP